MNMNSSNIADSSSPPPPPATIFQQASSAPKSGSSIFGQSGGAPTVGGGFSNVFAFNWYVTPNQVAKAPDGDKYVARENLPFVVTLVAVAGAILIVGVVTGVILHYMKATKQENSEGHLERQPQSSDKKITAPAYNSKEADVGGVTTLTTSSITNAHTHTDHMNLPTSRITSAVYSPIASARPISTPGAEPGRIMDEFDTEPLDSPATVPNQVAPAPPTTAERCHTILEEEEYEVENGLTMGASQTNTICMSEDAKTDIGDYYTSKPLPAYSVTAASVDESLARGVNYGNGRSFNNF